MMHRKLHPSPNSVTAAHMYYISAINAE